MMDLNEGVLRDDENNSHCFVLYKASARHPELRIIFAKKGLWVAHICVASEPSRRQPGLTSISLARRPRKVVREHNPISPDP
jgi:hypothetical protein